MINGSVIIDEAVGDFGINVPRVLVSGRYAVVDSVKKIYVLREDIVTLGTADGYISVIGNGISVETLCDERIVLRGVFSGIEFISDNGKPGSEKPDSVRTSGGKLTGGKSGGRKLNDRKSDGAKTGSEKSGSGKLTGGKSGNRKSNGMNLNKGKGTAR